MRRPADTLLVAELVRHALAPERVAPAGDISPQQVDWAIRAGLGPLLWAALGNRAQLPPTDAARLHAADLEARCESGDQWDAVEEGLDAAKGHVQPPTLLKGISLACTHYPEPHLRLMGDVDLLAAPGEAETLDARLGELGWERVRWRHREGHHHLPPRRHPRTGVLLEVHRGLFPARSGLAGSPPFTASWVEAESRPGTFRGRPVRHLAPELQLAYTASHWAFDLRPAAGARALLDAKLLIEATPGGLAWDRILRWRDPRPSAHLQLLLGYLQARRLAALPAPALPLLAGPLGRASLGVLFGLVDRDLVAGSRRDADRTALVWDTLLNGPSPGGGSWLRLPWNLLFPPTQPDRFRLGFQLQRIRAALRRGIPRA